MGKSSFKTYFGIAILALFLHAQTEGAVIQTVQRGTSTFASGQNTLPVTLTALNPAKTIVWGGINWGGGRDASANANATRVGFDLASATTLNLQRLGAPTQATVVEWEAIEFASGVSVQRGRTSFLTTDLSLNVSITGVNLSESFVLISVVPNSASQIIDEEWTVRTQLTSSTNLELSRNESGIALDVYWQVISFTGASVQRGLTTIASGAASATVTIASVNTAKTFLLLTQRAAGASNGIEAQYMVRGRITSPTQLTLDRMVTTNSVDIAWEVITLNDSSTVQSGSIAFQDGEATGTVTLSSVTLGRSASFINVRGGSAGVSNNLDELSITHTLTNPTTLTVTRVSPNLPADAAWFVVQFPANTAPVLDSIGAKTVTEGSNLTFRVHATDSNATIPVLTASNIPLNATFVDSGNGAGSFTFNPSFIQSGVYSVTFRASDGVLVDSEVVTVTVTEAGNQAPVLDSIRSKTVAENSNLTFRVHATDPDATPLTLTAANVPLNATFVDSGNGAGSFVFNPDFTQAGVYNVTFRASDGSLLDTEVVAITVTNTNRAPVLDSIGAKTVAENSNLTFRVHATDPDATIPVLSASNVPLNATFVDSGNGAGSFTFNPSFIQSGVYSVTFRASDGVLVDSEVVTVTVIEAGNQAPVLDSIGAKTVAEGANLTFRVHSSDADGDSLILTVPNLPANAVFIDSANGAGSFSFSPDYTQAGLIPVTFKASDGTAVDSEVVDITVTNVCLAKAGDINADGNIRLTDIVLLVNYLFRSWPAPSPLCRGDANGNGVVLLPDVIYLINFLFRAGPAPVNSVECCL